MKRSGLVIVESPTKAKTISRILGEDFTIVSSMGHMIDLPQKELGVDVENGFRPHYVVMPGKQKMLSQLKKQAHGQEAVYIATDPDREGEAIGWQLKERAFADSRVLRVVFHEITPQAVKEAFNQPREFDPNMVEAQASRRILDRLVGYFLSPLLWRKIARGLSAGRVQSVALRLIVEREGEIGRFLPQEYWEIEAELEKNGAAESRFLAKLANIGQGRAQIKTKEEAERLVADIKNKPFLVASVEKKETLRRPEPPFITSTLQQEAFNKLGFNATKTMIIAQQLYEGIDIGSSGPVGLITYMRTDSTRTSPGAIKEVRNVILNKHGKEYLPKVPHVYKVKRFAQQAHEAIRPTLIADSPEGLKGYLSPDQYKLYELIYRRFLASQMVAARYSLTTVKISAGEYIFAASGSSLVFAGFMVIYNRNNETDNQETKDRRLPLLQKEEKLNLLSLAPSQHFTKPAPRFSDGSLVKALEENGIGRPSTYAPTIYTLLQRNYVRRIRGYFSPTELGIKVCELLVEYFPKIMDVKFTASMEDELDRVEEGGLKRLKVLEDFYQPFKEGIDFAQKHIKKEVVQTKEVCVQCGRPMVIKWGRKGKFLSCSGFPECKYSKSITSGVKCPQEACGGELIERRSARGFFYGCSNFPKCRFTSKALPEGKEQNGQPLNLEE